MQAHHVAVLDVERVGDDTVVDRAGHEDVVLARRGDRVDEALVLCV